jgi:UDP-N-acetylglucosamine 2-epimerase (non-hydrolysing)
MPKITLVVGNRPQFIKLMPVYRALLKTLKPRLVHTGQHHDYQMSEVFFQDLELPVPDVNLGVSGGNHGELTGRLLIELEKEFLANKPEWLILFGDTNSTMAAALAAVKLHIKIAHVESGPRMHDDFESPEEANRVMTERISSLLFPPNQECLENIGADGRSAGVHFVGDTMLDTFKIVQRQFSGEKLAPKYGLAGEEFNLLTLHRPRNVDEPVVLGKILDFLLSLNRKILFPVHPRTVASLKRFALWDKIHQSERIILTEPLGYVELQRLLAESTMVITDSGGLQKEACFAGKRCLNLYPLTPWPQLLEAGMIHTVDPIVETLTPELTEWSVRGEMPSFGNGDAGEKIAKIILEKIEKNN